MSTNYNYNELAHPFSVYQEVSDSKIPISDDPDYQDVRNVKLTKLRNRYFYYLGKYEQSYGYYLLFSSKNTKQKISGPELRKLKELIVVLNDKLMNIAQAINSNNDKTKQDISNAEGEIKIKNKDIADQNSLLKHQTNAFKNKRGILTTEKKMITLGGIRNNYKWKTYFLLFILNIVIFSILVSLYYKVYNQ
jgi:hypothetical protein